MSSRTQIAHNLASIQARITAACLSAGRSPEAVQMVAVTKYAEPQWIDDLMALGQRDFGESRPQQLVERAAAYPTDVRWHLIGHLQRNKVELVVSGVELIHSVDSLRLLEKVESEARKRNVMPRVLLEVNVSGEAAKDGFTPEELRSEIKQLTEVTAVRIVGLMTMAAQTADPEDARPTFRELREFRNELTTLSDGRLNIPHLSMGMSGDFDVAIEEGATIIRIGTSLFAGAGQV